MSNELSRNCGFPLYTGMKKMKSSCQRDNGFSLYTGMKNTGERLSSYRFEDFPYIQG